MEDGLFRTIAEICGTAIMGVGGYSLRRHNNRISSIELAAEKDRVALGEYKLEAEQRFAKDNTMQHSLERIHSRLDDIVKLILEK